MSIDQRAREILRCCRGCGSGCGVIDFRNQGVLFTHVSRTGGTTIADPESAHWRGFDALLEKASRWMWRGWDTDSTRR